MGPTAEQISMLQPVEEPPLEQVDVAWRRLRPMESPSSSRPRAGASACGEEPTHEQGVWGQLPPTCGGLVLEQFAPGGWTLWYGAVWEQFLKSCCLWAVPAGSVREGQHPVEGTPHGAGEEHEEEEAAETNPYELTTTPTPHPSAPLGVGRRLKNHE